MTFIYFYFNMLKKYSCIKKCFVPMCLSSSNKMPDKKFILVPLDLEIRQQWFKSVHKTYVPERDQAYHCCEDHFDFNTDLDGSDSKNFTKTFTVKEGLLPHLLQCQEDYRRECASRPLVEIEKFVKKPENEKSGDGSQLKDDEMDVDQDGRQFKKIVYDGNKKLTLYIKTPENVNTDNIHKTNNNNILQTDDDSDIEISSLSTISSVSSTGLDTSWDDLSLYSD